MHVFNVVIEANDPPVEAQVAELAPEQSLEDLFERIYKNTDADARIRASIVIVRPPVKWPIDSTAIERITAAASGNCPASCRFLADALAHPTTTFRRVAGKPVHILASHDYRPFLSRNVNPAATYSPIDDGDLSADTAIREVRDAEIDLLVDVGRAKLPRASGVLYLAPSNRLMRSFLRVGNIQRSRAALDAMFFWLLPNLRDCIGIVTDTWSISSISMNASRRLCTYSGGAAPPCPVEMLSQYLDGSLARTTEAAEIVERLVARTNPGQLPVDGAAERPTIPTGRVVFIISATHTGSLVERLQRLLRDRGIRPEAVHFVALFKVGPAIVPMVSLRDLSVGVGAQDFAPVEAADVEPKYETIKIDEQVYFPVQYKDIPFRVREAQTSDLCEFLRRYRNADLVRVHRTVQDDGQPRHHTVWINTVALASDAVFQERFAAYLRTLEPTPDLIVTPMHEAAELLGRIALATIHERKSDAQLKTHSNLLISNPPRPGDEAATLAVDAVPQDGAILILDDAFITGRRLVGYQTHVRERTFLGRLHYVVAIARPPRLAAWEMCRRMLSFRRSQDPERPVQRNTVHAIETIVLPNWNEDDCPWCAEIALYRQREGMTGERLSDQTLRERLKMLTNSAAIGLSTELFLSVPGFPALEITRGSILVEAPASQAAVYAAVAGALQRLRTPDPTQEDLALGPRHFPISTVLDDAEYLEHTYTDSVLRASFLRAAQQYELVYAKPDAETKRAERARALVLSDVQTELDLAAEIVLAASAGKFPELALDEGTLIAKLESLGIGQLAAALN